MVASISLTMRYALMAAIMMTAFFTVQAEANNVKKSLHQQKMREIAQYITQKIAQGTKLSYEYNSTIQQKIDLPLIEEGYTASLECSENRVTVNISANLPTESSTIKTNLRCGTGNQLNVSGEVIPGERCLKFNKKNNTFINVKMVKTCGA